MKKLFFILLIVFVLFTSGCTSNTNINQLVKELPEVKEFLQEHPNADITAVLWSSQYIKDNMEKIPEKCLPSIEKNKDYYNVEINENDREMFVWIREEGNKVACVIYETENSGDIKLAFSYILKNKTECDLVFWFGTDIEIKSLKSIIDFGKYGGVKYNISQYDTITNVMKYLKDMNNSICFYEYYKQLPSNLEGFGYTSEDLEKLKGFKYVGGCVKFNSKCDLLGENESYSIPITIEIMDTEGKNSILTNEINPKLYIYPNVLLQNTVSGFTGFQVPTGGWSLGTNGDFTLILKNIAGARINVTSIEASFGTQRAYFNSTGDTSVLSPNDQYTFNVSNLGLQTAGSSYSINVKVYYTNVATMLPFSSTGTLTGFVISDKRNNLDFVF